MIVDHRWVIERGYSFVRLLRELVGLDYASVEGLDEHSEGTPENWAPIFEKSLGTWRLIVNSDGAVMAYWCFFFLSDSALERVRNGTFFDGELREDDVKRPSPGLSGAIYFPMLTTHPALRGDRALTKLLFLSMASALRELEADSIVLTEVHGNAFSASGAKTAIKFGLLNRGESLQGGKIYSGRPRLEKLRAIGSST